MDLAPTITMGQAQALVQVVDKIMELLPHQSVNQVHQPSTQGPSSSHSATIPEANSGNHIKFTLFNGLLID